MEKKNKPLDEDSDIGAMFDSLLSQNSADSDRIFELEFEKSRRISRRDKTIIEKAVLAFKQEIAEDLEICRTVRDLIEHYSVSIGNAHFIFEDIQNELEKMRSETIDGKTPEEKDKYLDMAIFSIRCCWQDYCDDLIKTNLAKLDLIQGLLAIEELLANDYILSLDYFSYALETEKAEIERKIAAREKDLELRNRLGFVESKQIAANGETEGDLQQRVFALLLLLFGHLQIPDNKEDLRTDIINFVAFITGHHRQNVKEALKNPTAYKVGSKRSRDKILSALRVVRKHFRALDLKSRAEALTNEAKEILRFSAEELEEE